MILSIIIVNWNVKNLLEKCLASVYKETRNLNFEVIVIDNNSMDGSVEMVRKSFPQVKLIANKANRWFAGGNNQGLEIAQGELILLLNPDTIVLDGAINKMVGAMSDSRKQKEEKEGNEFQGKSEIENRELRINGNIGVLGCKLLNPDLTLQPSCRRLPRILDQVLVLIKMHNFFPRLKPITEYYMLDFKHEETMEVEQVMGACFMTRKVIIDKIGCMDEKYGSIFEEVDLCKRIIDAGWKIYFTDHAQIIHYKGQSFRQRRIITNQKNFNHALLRYFYKHKPFWQYLILLFLWPVSMGLAILDQAMIVFGIKSFKAKFKKRNF